MSELVRLNTLKKINEDDCFIVCCFYTKSYEGHALSLKESLDKFNLSYHFSEVADAGYWEANTRLKPHVILDCLISYPTKNILYLDTDAIVKKPLDYFNTLAADGAFYHAKGKAGMSHDYLTGTMFFKNNAPILALVKQWIAEQSSGKRTQVDQDSFDAAMQKLAHTLTIESLPAGYIKIFDKNYAGEVYIEQYQASRSQTKLRRRNIRRRNRIIGLVIVATVSLVCYRLLF